MSRIHEALKKAEEQRTAGVTHNEQSLQPAVEEMPAEHMAMPTMAPSTAAPDPERVSAAGVPSFGAGVSVETLLSRCVAGNWTPDRKTMLFFNGDEQGYGTEEFRTLRSRLYQVRERQSLKKILVTSALPKEGKSFVAANLAQVMVRQHGRRALLVDSDLRGARLHTALGTDGTPGVSDYLLGEADEYAILQRGPMENLFFIGSGRSVTNPAELVANGRLKLLLNRMEPLFDWIIVDSPPAVPVSDAGLLANYCDGVLMVVRSNSTPFDMARKARQEFSGRQLVGVVLNGIDQGNSYTQYYYDAYGRPNGKTEPR
jgi:protein-tyrosine kinase